MTATSTTATRFLARHVRIVLAGSALLAGAGLAQEPLSFDTSLGELAIAPLGHGSLRFEVGGTVLHVDPWSDATDYAEQPDADWILITHDHPDHYDPAAIAAVTGEGTRVLLDPATAEAFEGDATVLANGESAELGDVAVTAVPAYNLERMRDDGTPYHPRGAYNGYLLRFGDFTVHVGGDTECVPELAEMGEVDVSFLPINLPFTMPPEDAADCYREVIDPAVAVPYHQGESDPQVVADRLEGSGIDVRVLDLP